MLSSLRIEIRLLLSDSVYCHICLTTSSNLISFNFAAKLSASPLFLIGVLDLYIVTNASGLAPSGTKSTFVIFKFFNLFGITLYLLSDSLTLNTEHGVCTIFDFFPHAFIRHMKTYPPTVS